MSLSEALADATRRDLLVADAILELEAELDDRSGVGGVALRTAYRSAQKLRPGFIEANLARLMPTMAEVLDPHLAAGRAVGDVAGHFQTNGPAITADLLNVTDDRVTKSSNTVANKVYAKLRPKAGEHVLAGMARLARLAQTHG